MFHRFTFPPGVSENSSCFIHFLTCGAVRVLNFDHSNRNANNNRNVVLSHCYLNLQFPDDIQCRVSFQVLIWYHYIFFGDIWPTFYLNWLYFYFWILRVICSFWKIICCNSVPKLGPTSCNPMNCSTQGFPVLHYLLEFSQTHVYWVGNVI